MKINNIFLIFYSLSSLIYYVKSNIEKLYLSDKIIYFKYVTEPKYYQVIPSMTILPSYIKITVIGSSSSNTIISYYQHDSSFKDRKQLSQNNTNYGTVVMWLNKEQIKDIFYLSIEFENPDSYNINITYHDYIDIYLKEQYIYYVNEENKEMNFSFCIDNIFTKMKLVLWAKG